MLARGRDRQWRTLPYGGRQSVIIVAIDGRHTRRSGGTDSCVVRWPLAVACHLSVVPSCA